MWEGPLCPDLLRFRAVAAQRPLPHWERMTTRRKMPRSGVRARLTKDFQFEAAQTLPKAPEGHKCRRMHGHSFKVEISVEGEVDPAIGWLYDHAQISAAMK